MRNPTTQQAIDQITPGTVVVVRPNFGIADPIRVTATSSCEMHKGRYAFDYESGQGTQWAYTSQLDEIIGD